MEIEGKVVVVMPLKQGTTKNGEPYGIVNFVVETQEQYPHKVALEYFDKGLTGRVKVGIGQNVRVSFDIKADEWQGKWYNKLSVWKVENLDAAPAPAPAPMAAQQPNDEYPF